MQMVVRVQTLCMIFDEERILLGKKKRGFGTGRWNGFGGDIEDGESVEVAAVRETVEECGVTPKQIVRRGYITGNRLGLIDQLVVHLFVTSQYTGEPRETVEMEPRWFPRVQIPYKQMMPFDELWLPLVLAGHSIMGDVTYDVFATKMLEHKLRKY